MIPLEPRQDSPVQAHRRLDFFEYVWWRLFGISSSILFSMGYLLLRIVTLLWIVPRITKRVNEVNEHGESCQLHLCCQSFRNGRDDHERKNEKNGALVVGCNTKKSITAKTGSILGKLSPFPFSFSSSTCMVHEPMCKDNRLSWSVITIPSGKFGTA